MSSTPSGSTPYPYLSARSLPTVPPTEHTSGIHIHWFSYFPNTSSCPPWFPLVSYPQREPGQLSFCSHTLHWCTDMRLSTQYPSLTLEPVYSTQADWCRAICTVKLVQKLWCLNNCWFGAQEAEKNCSKMAGDSMETEVGVTKHCCA